MHFWTGYYCLVDKEDGVLDLSQNLGVSDVITIVSDLGNKIPDKSWMLYLLELFNKQHIPVELNLICSFNDDGKFHAIFEGENKYEFKIKPIVGNSYLRQIIMEPSKQRIAYHLKDEVSGQTESFFIDVDGNSFDFSISKHFTGLEWHNRVGDTPYPIRYEVEISNLAYGINDNSSDLESLVYYPYNQLLSDDEGLAKEYPVTFDNFDIRNRFITYRISTGKHNIEIVNKFFKPHL
ncbi:MAG TPA: hypothetical protein VFG24_06405 [Nitrosopumilaceae archaeon]|nr:hypothetical protein [Nitrosopumilaceae archaeon]